MGSGRGGEPPGAPGSTPPPRAPGPRGTPPAGVGALRRHWRSSVTGKNYLKTTLLLAVMSGLLLGIGALLGGNWITIALVVAIAMNGFAYFFSDKIAIRAAGEVPGR